MLTRTDIKSYTVTTSYNKGLDLYRRGMVMKFSVEEEPGMHTLSAAVKGSGRNQYQVYMEYDTEEDCLRRIGCECRLFISIAVSASIVWRCFLSIWSGRTGRGRSLSMRSGRRRAGRSCSR